MNRRSAGSDEDKSLANRIYGEFRKQQMDPWTDIHYVQLQMPDRLIWDFDYYIFIFTSLDKLMDSDYFVWGTFF